jgi:hypothetical protein
MSATQWKTRGAVLPYAPRNWPIAHVALCIVEADAPVEPLAIEAGALADDREAKGPQGSSLTDPLLVR